MANQHCLSKSSLCSDTQIRGAAIRTCSIFDFLAPTTNDGVGTSGACAMAPPPAHACYAPGSHETMRAPAPTITTQNGKEPETLHVMSIDEDTLDQTSPMLSSSGKEDLCTCLTSRGVCLRVMRSIFFMFSKKMVRQRTIHPLVRRSR